MMKAMIAAAVLGLLMSTPLWAACTHYEMRVDGLACPYCAYGIEKKLTAIDGVDGLDVDLEAGIVRVDVRDGIELSETDMRQLFNDAGFTYRSMTISHEDHGAGGSQQ